MLLGWKKMSERTKYARAYDLDGTLLNNGNGETFLKRLFWVPKLGKDRHEVYLVVTGRPGGRLKSALTKYALKMIGYWNVKEVMMNPLPPTPENIALFKLKALHDLGVEEYIDDDEKTRQRLASLGWGGRCKGRREMMAEVEARRRGEERRVKRLRVKVGWKTGKDEMRRIA